MNHAGSLVSYDDKWQGVDVTERQALNRAAQFLPTLPGVAYFGFPWATLLDRRELTADQDLLTVVLRESSATLGSHHTVVTVCQHPAALNHQQFFANANVTHIYWTYADHNTTHLPDYPQIKVLPFPSAPLIPQGFAATGLTRHQLLAQADEAKPFASEEVGSESSEGCDPHGDPPFLSKDIWQILTCCQFALCAGGPTLDRSWLWTAVACETIPVFIGEMPNLPGNRSLWEEATVQHAGNAIDLGALLKEHCGDNALISRKRHALRQIRLLYGAEYFIYDIMKLFISLVATAESTIAHRPGSAFGRLESLAAQINATATIDPALADVFILGCGSRSQTDPLAFISLCREDSRFLAACQKALCHCDSRHAANLHATLDGRGLSLDASGLRDVSGAIPKC